MDLKQVTLTIGQRFVFVSSYDGDVIDGVFAGRDANDGTLVFTNAVSVSCDRPGMHLIHESHVEAIEPWNSSIDLEVFARNKSAASSAQKAADRGLKIVG